jgi:hypothetical protein
MKLSTGEVYNITCLDHDLGGQVNQSSGLGTGYEVAKWLSEHTDRKSAQIIIHSFNIPGAKNMLSVLPEAVHIPGLWAMKNIL